MKLRSACSGCFAGLSCGVRIEILGLLQAGKRLSVMEIAKHFEVKQPTITHHLKYLEKAGILASKRQGRKIYYSISPKCGWETCEVFR